MRILIIILAEPMWLQLIYFLNAISFWFVECFFSIDGTLKLAYYFRVLQNLLFFLPHKSAIMENTRHRINQFQLFYFDKSNQIKFSRESFVTRAISLKLLWGRGCERDISETSLKHLKRDYFFVASLRRLKYMSKRCLLCDVSETSQKHLSQVFVIFQKFIIKMISSDFRRVITISDKIDVGPLETLKK